MLGMDDSDSPVDEPPPPVDLPGPVVVDPGTIVLADPVGAPDMLDEPGVELGQPVLAGDEETASEDEPIVIDGINVRRKRAFEKYGRAEAARYFVDPCPLHGPECTKSRSVQMGSSAFGVHAPRVYIGCWLEKAVGNTAEWHKAYVPSMAEMRNYAVRKNLI